MLSRLAASQSPIGNLKRNHHFCSGPLERIVPPRPAVKQTTLYEERIKEDRYRRGPPHQTDLVVPSQCIARGVDQGFGLLRGIALLRGEPARQRLAIVMVNDPLILHNLTVESTPNPFPPQALKPLSFPQF